MPPRERRDDITVKIGAALYRKAKMVAAFRDLSLAEYLTEVLEKPVARDYEKLIEQMRAGENGDSA
jgi:hypothetical protein